MFLVVSHSNSLLEMIQAQLWRMINSEWSLYWPLVSSRSLTNILSSMNMIFLRHVQESTDNWPRIRICRRQDTVCILHDQVFVAIRSTALNLHASISAIGRSIIERLLTSSACGHSSLFSLAILCRAISMNMSLFIIDILSKHETHCPASSVSANRLRFSFPTLLDRGQYWPQGNMNKSTSFWNSCPLQANHRLRISISGPIIPRLGITLSTFQTWGLKCEVKRRLRDRRPIKLMTMGGGSSTSKTNRRSRYWTILPFVNDRDLTVLQQSGTKDCMIDKIQSSNRYLSGMFQTRILNIRMYFPWSSPPVDGKP